MIGQGHFFELHGTYPAFEILLVIEQENPENVQQRIKEPEIKMLVFMKRIPFLGLAHAHPGLDVNIIINSVHVGVGMMDHIVLHIPHETVPAKYVQGKSGQVIDPLVFAKTPVSPVMHDIEPYRRHQATQQNALQDSPECRRCEEYQVYIHQYKAHHQEKSLYK